MNMRRVTLAVVAMTAVLSTAACTAQGVNGTPVNQTQAPLPPAQIDNTVLMKASTNAQIGETVVDGAGYTLYRFERDTPKPPKSNCLEECILKWPPLIDTGNLKIEGVDQAIVGTMIRSDFERQVTIAGWPVYRFGGDSSPGDVKGHGSGNLWFAITPTGKKAPGGAANGAPASQAPAN
jgi:predicted lipoprotein with Yx(FWY)xxD motif